MRMLRCPLSHRCPICESCESACARGVLNSQRPPPAPHTHGHDRLKDRLLLPCLKMESLQLMYCVAVVKCVVCIEFQPGLATYEVMFRL